MLSDVVLPASRSNPEAAPAEAPRWRSRDQQTIAELRQQLAQKSIELAQQKLFLQKAREALVHMRQIVKILSLAPGSSPAPASTPDNGEGIDDPAAIAGLLRAQQATIERLTHELRVAKANVAESRSVAKLSPAGAPASASPSADNFVAIAFDQADQTLPKVDVLL